MLNQLGLEDIQLTELSGLSSFFVSSSDVSSSNKKLNGILYTLMFYVLNKKEIFKTMFYLKHIIIVNK